MFGLFIVLLIIVIAVLGYRMLTKPVHERIINKLGTGIWLVDKTGIGGGPSYYIKFGEFKQDPASSTPAGKVQFTKYGMDKAFEFESELDWARADDSLRVGQSRLKLATAMGRVPTIMYTNNVEAVDSWTAPLRESNPPSGKL
jgi:hypothetical protein